VPVELDKDRIRKSEVGRKQDEKSWQRMRIYAYMAMIVLASWFAYSYYQCLSVGPDCRGLGKLLAGIIKIIGKVL